MKVLAINPGSVWPTREGKWKYSLNYTTPHKIIEIAGTKLYDFAPAAKQAMREKLSQERKKYCI